MWQLWLSHELNQKNNPKTSQWHDIRILYSKLQSYDIYADLIMINVFLTTTYTHKLLFDTKSIKIHIVYYILIMMITV